jgi:hypothetical protein
MRLDAPGRLPTSRGSLPALSVPADRAAAVDALLAGTYAKSSRGVHAALWRTITSALSKWGHLPLPPTAEKVMALGAALKAGGYSSAENYLGHYKVQCERAGSPFCQALGRVHTDTLRSCKRGVGGPVKALALPLLRLGELGLYQDEPWVQGGPVGPGCAMVAGAWFLTREVELSTTRACLVTFEVNGDGAKVVKWSLPASKSDVEARGVARAHGCCCGLVSMTPSCPYHAILAQLSRLKRMFPERWTAEGPAPDLPLFPASDGSVVTKERMTETIIEAARLLGVALASADGSGRVSGHSLRATGAQGLARAGLDVWAIQLLGRWGSSSVLSYIREVPLELSASWASRAAQHQSLDDLLRARASEPQCPSGSSSSAPSSSRALALPAPPFLAPVTNSLQVALVEAECKAAVVKAPMARCMYISSSSGKWHRFADTKLSGACAGWASACGWKFAGTLASFEADLPVDIEPSLLCARCFSEARAVDGS